mmetsp:Transcript_32941/g.93352  ORF Transcript_32941/g.93352 Transcript_32941/m.93352 type:complete len:216 (+) Transcript_32941:82-729(+)
MAAWRGGLVPQPECPAAEPLVVGHMGGVAHGADGRVLVVDDALRHPLHLVRSHGVYPGKQLLLGDAAAVGEQLSADVLSHAGGAVLGEEGLRLELVASAGHLALVRSVDHLGHVIDHGPGHVLGSGRAADRIHSKEAGVMVVGVECHVAVTQVVGGHQLGDTGAHMDAGCEAGVPTAEHGLHHHQGNGIGVGPGHTLEGQSQMNLWHVGVRDLHH